MLSDVLAAPDLTRYTLVGPNPDQADRPYAQALWSRTRGLVLSASRMPVLQAGSTYQIWLLTSDAPVSAGTFTPDPAGQATFTLSAPPKVPRAVTGVLVTLEPDGGAATPGTSIVLSRVQQ